MLGAGEAATYKIASYQVTGRKRQIDDDTETMHYDIYVMSNGNYFITILIRFCPPRSSEQDPIKLSNEWYPL